MERERWFYRSDDEWIALVERLKLTACPYCRATGTLVRHGSVVGFDDADPPRKTQRARRIFAAIATDRPDADEPSASGSPTRSGD